MKSRKYAPKKFGNRRDFMFKAAWGPLGMLNSDRWHVRHLNMYLRSTRGVLTPIIRGCSEPQWLREA